MERSKCNFVKSGVSECLDYSFVVELRNLAGISGEGVDKITMAWSENYDIYAQFRGNNFNDACVIISATRDVRRKYGDCVNIKSDWLEFARVLKNAEFPLDWLEHFKFSKEEKNYDRGSKSERIKPNLRGRGNHEAGEQRGTKT